MRATSNSADETLLAMKRLLELERDDVERSRLLAAIAVFEAGADAVPGPKPTGLRGLLASWLAPEAPRPAPPPAQPSRHFVRRKVACGDRVRIELVEIRSA